MRSSVSEALKAGYRHVDCAAYYANEGEVGDALQSALAGGVCTRGDLFVCSKLWNADHGRSKVEAACRKSLAALKLDYLDLYLVHWPISGNAGPAVSPTLADTWAGLEDLVSKGLVRSIGLSNFSSAKVAHLLQAARIAPAVLQCECHPFFRQSALREWCRGEGIHFTAYSPLGSPDSAAILHRSAAVRLARALTRDLLLFGGICGWDPYRFVGPALNFEFHRVFPRASVSRFFFFF